MPTRLVLGGYTLAVLLGIAGIALARSLARYAWGRLRRRAIAHLARSYEADARRSAELAAWYAREAGYWRALQEE